MAKGKFALNRLLHNNKLMIVFSIIAAIAIWASVVYNDSTTEVRSMTLTANLDLAGSYAEADGLRIYEGASQSIKVEVRGPRARIYSLTENDMQISYDYSDIRGAGDWPVYLSVTRNSAATGYEIVSGASQSVQVYCDYPMTSSAMKVEADISGISVKEGANVQLGTPVIEAPGMEDGAVYIEGPRTVVSKIASVRARILEPEEIDDVTAFEAELVALDADGNEVDMKYCTFSGMTDTSVTVTIPVNVHRTVEFQYTLENLPAAYQNMPGFCTVSPSSIEVVGTPERVEAFVESVQNLGVFDFHHIGLGNSEQTIPLNVPQGLVVLDNTTDVKVSFAMSGFGQRVLDLPLTSSNITVANDPDGRVSVSRQTIRDVRIVGPADTLSRITASDLSVIADVEGISSTGAVPIKVDIEVDGYDDVWVYYGEGESDGYEIYLTIQ
ncbi:MAG TPA: hypothetical protein H9694_07655 [Firmicutes bacterium]|nr:hypothetical protein [Bacillota bacterium]